MVNKCCVPNCTSVFAVIVFFFDYDSKKEAGIVT